MARNSRYPDKDYLDLLPEDAREKLAPPKYVPGKGRDYAKKTRELYFGRVNQLEDAMDKWPDNHVMGADEYSTWLTILNGALTDSHHQIFTTRVTEIKTRFQSYPRESPRLRSLSPSPSIIRTSDGRQSQPPPDEARSSGVKKRDKRPKEAAIRQTIRRPILKRKVKRDVNYVYS